MGVSPFFDLSMLAYLLELLISELLFCSSSRRRGPPLLRAGLFCGLVLLYYFAALRVSPYGASGLGLRFLGFLTTLSFSVGSMFLLYADDTLTLISSAVAGIAAQHAANKVYHLLTALPVFPSVFPAGSLPAVAAEFTVTVLLTLPLYLAFGRNVRSNRRSLSVNLLSPGIVLICVGLNRFVTDSPLRGTGLWCAANVYALVCCLLALWLRYYIFRWEQEKNRAMMVGRLLTESEKQYGQWTATVNEMRHSAHDIRHMLRRVERLAAERQLVIPDMAEVRSAVDRLLPSVRTGNEVLDILLRNSYELCQLDGIQLQFVAYTDKLRYFEGISLYFLMANAIDNAMVGAAGVTQPDKRLIDISIRDFGDSVAIHIWNYFQGGLSFEGELPVTEAEGHGYGMRGMKSIVERFSGSMSVRAEGDIFHLNLMLPLPEDTAGQAPVTAREEKAQPPFFRGQEE